MATSIPRYVKNCNNNEGKTETKPQVIAEQAYIIEEDVLHAGSIIKTASGDYILKFNCGNHLHTNQFKAYTAKPSEDKYNQKCCICFSEEKDL